MTFSKPITGTFAFEGIIPSAAMNIINNAIPNALDKTGDNTTTSPTGGISGRIDVLNGGSILGQLGSQIGVETGGLLFVNAGEFNVVGAGQVNFGGDSSAATLNMFGSTITTFNAGAKLVIGNQPSLGSGGIQFGTGSIQSSLSFGSQIGTVFIEQVGQSTTAANGNTLWLIAQAGGAASTTTGGTLILSGGVGGQTGGNVELVSGIGNVPGTVNIQQPYAYLPNTGNPSGGQTGKIYRQVFFCTTSGTSTQSFVPYIFTLISSLTFVAEITYTCKNVPVGGKAYSFGVAGSQTTGNLYGSAAGIIQVGSNLAVNITPPAGGDSFWQIDCYLQLN